MPTQLPLSLLLAWVLFFLSAVGQFQHEQLIRREAPFATRLLRVVEISQLLWLVAALGILIYYFVAARWYWPFVLAIPGSMLAAVLAGIMFNVVGERLGSMIGLIAWPVSAAWALLTIHALPA